MDHRENNPEHQVPFPKYLQTHRQRRELCALLHLMKHQLGVSARTYHPEHGEEDDHSQAGIGSVSTCVDVWVSLLVQL